MKILNRKIWITTLGISAVTFFSAATVFAGFQGALAALGVMVLTGMTGAGIYMMLKVRWYSKALKASSLEPDEVSSPSRDKVIYGRTCYMDYPRVNPIGEEDKRLIMKYVNELFVPESVNSDKEFAEVKPVSKMDKWLIMKHIDELFETEPVQSEEEYSETKPISERDKKLIMGHIDELFMYRPGTLDINPR